MGPFHARDGWYFEREADGSVAITCPGQSITLDASTWASVVASVSRDGGTAESYQRAVDAQIERWRPALDRLAEA